jgi:hypothetical protein
MLVISNKNYEINKVTQGLNWYDAVLIPAVIFAVLALWLADSMLD